MWQCTKLEIEVKIISFRKHIRIFDDFPYVVIGENSGKRYEVARSNYSETEGYDRERERFCLLVSIN